MMKTMKVAEILDKTTLVISGEGVELLLEDDEIYILSVGREIRDSKVTLIVPKAKVVVTAAAGAYAIARSQLVEVIEDPMRTLTLMMPRKRQVRPALSVDEDAMVGNPGRSPIAIGDPVVKSDDLPDLVKRMAEEEDQ